MVTVPAELEQLEWALVQYPKFAKERWENIAKAVPGKSN